MIAINSPSKNIEKYLLRLHAKASKTMIQKN